MTLKIKYKHTDMKRIWLYTICLGLVGLFACQQEDLPSVGETGFLSLENMTVEVANTESISTRAVDDDDLYVEISSQDVTPEVTLKYNPGDIIPDKIELGTGRYALKIYNDTTLLDKTPVYYKDTIFEIEAGKVNYLSVKVPMINWGVQLDLPQNFADWFDEENYTFTVKVGKAGEVKTVELKNEEIAYFPHSSDVTLSYQLDATNNDGESFNSGDIIYDEALSPGTIYVITYDYATKALRLLEP